MTTLPRALTAIILICGAGPLAARAATTSGAAISNVGSESAPSTKADAGELISISLQDGQLSEVFRLLHQFSGKNIVVAQSVKDMPITVELRDVSWEDAMAVVLEANGLGQAVDGNVIRILPLGDAARETLTRARLAVDLGDRAQAMSLLAPLAANERLERELRCEAMVRQGVLLVQDGRRREGFSLYNGVASRCADQVEALRLLTEAITGVQQDPATWRGRTERVSLSWNGDPTGDGDLDTPAVTFVGRASGPTPVDAEEWRPDYFRGDLISVSMKNADIVDTLALFSSFSGVHIEATEEVRPVTVTMDLADVPWDQALMSMLASKGLRAMKVPGGLRVEVLPEGAPAPVDPLMRSVRICLDAYKQDNGHYPIVSGEVPVDEIAALLEPLYIRVLPRHAVDGTPYVYSCSDGVSYELRAEATQ